MMKAYPQLTLTDIKGLTAGERRVLMDIARQERARDKLEQLSLHSMSTPSSDPSTQHAQRQFRIGLVLQAYDEDDYMRGLLLEQLTRLQ